MVATAPIADAASAHAKQRVLVLHSRYRSGPISGENRVVDDEVSLLTKAGHVVHLYAPTPEAGSVAARARTGAAAIWNRRAVAEVLDMVHQLEPDVVHTHNLFPGLSPAVLGAVSGSARVVMTLHNFRLLCLPATLLRNGRPCQDCVGRAPWPGVVHRCYRSSLAGSAALATSLVAHRKRGSFGEVDRFLAVSEFVRQTHVRGGLPAERIAVKPNFAWPSDQRVGAGDYFLYLGRLSPEKGIDRLVAGWPSQVGRLVVAGDGPLRPQLAAAGRDGVEVIGAVEPDDVPALLRGARAVVVPSVCYEGGPRTIAEAYSTGVAVIASDLGGLPELVDTGESGLLVPSDEMSAWVAAVERLSDDAEAVRMGEAAHARWTSHYGPDAAVTALETAYTCG